MPIRITASEVAEKILDILVTKIGLKAGQDVPEIQLKEKYRAHRHDAADLKAGFKYAVEREWLEHDQLRNVFRLTELGHDYAT